MNEIPTDNIRSLSVFWCVSSLLGAVLVVEYNLAVVAKFQIYNNHCIVPVIANQLLLGSNRHVLSSNQTLNNKLSPAFNIFSTNRIHGFLLLTFSSTNRSLSLKTFIPTPRVNAREFLDGDRLGKWGKLTTVFRLNKSFKRIFNFYLM